eukprot:m51a1_g8432 hypothetical protein (552) ;mRNA; f:351003-352722
METPSETFDVAIVGTGFVESVLSAALARAGKTVVHVDKNDYYGCASASHDVSAFADLLRRQGSLPAAPAPEGTALLLESRAEVSPPYDCAPDVELVTAPDSEQDILKGFLIDLSPVLLLSSGSLVDSLVRSGVSRYVDFKSVERCYLLPAPGAASGPAEAPRAALVEVPDSKSALFADKSLSLVEKRVLMKFLQHATRDGGPVDGEPTVGELLASEQFRASQLVSDVVCHALACGTGLGPDAPARSAAEALRDYARSCGKYSPSPFIVPLYGACEITQAFCRMSAVYGAVFMLRRAATAVAVSTEAPASAKDGADAPNEAPVCRVSLADGGVLSARTVVVAERLVRSRAPSSGDRAVQRCVVVTRTPVAPCAKAAWVVALPSAGRRRAATFTQLDAGMQVAPAGYFVLHGELADGEGARDELKGAVARLLEASGAVAVWSAYARATLRRAPEVSGQSGSVLRCSDVVDAVDARSALAEAEALFRRVCGPEATFLEPMPEPEEAFAEADEPPTSVLATAPAPPAPAPSESPQQAVLDAASPAPPGQQEAPSD